MHRSRLFLVWTCLLALVALPALAVEVAITSPTDGATVFGAITLAGTSADLVDGRVSVSIDGGPFRPALGTDPWTFDWDTVEVDDGLHEITARARECQGCPAALDTITVEVVSQGLAVRITSPEEGALVVDTLVVVGTSQNATEVALQVDDGPFQVANGLDPWTAVFEPGALAPGPHELTARAIDGSGGEVFDTLSIEVGDPPPGVQDFTYVSSVDGVPMTGVYYVPEGYDPDAGPTALVMHLHGGGGTGNISGEMQSALDARGWIGIAPDGRNWALHDPDDPESCGWRTSAAYVDSPDPAVGPGEQDMFDAIAWAQDAFAIDPDRIYLTGFSMGGRGTYAIGLKNPDFFAAIAPMGPAIDMYEVFVRRPEPGACKEGMVGGKPGDSPLVDTMYTITSGRFLVENAYNLPVFHGHGTQDTVASNTPIESPFFHGWHIVNDGGWSDCHGDSAFCFGHSPTLDELRTHHADDPDAYDWAYFFSPVGHSTDARWLHGAPPEDGDFGTDDPEAPGQLLGIYDFFARHSRVDSPDALVFKTYTDQHQRSHWAEIAITTPWQNVPGAIRARRSVGENRLSVELVRVADAMVDLPRAQLNLDPSRPLWIDLEPMVEPAYDPALLADGEVLEPNLALRADLSEARNLRVFRDGVELPTGLVVWDADGVVIGPLVVDGPSLLEVRVLGPGALFDDDFESGDTSGWSGTEGAPAPPSRIGE